MKKKRIAVLGSTGSIGRATLAVIEHLPQRLKLVAIAARTAAEAVCQQALRYRPKQVILTDPGAAATVRRKLPPEISVFAGIDAINRIACSPDVDLVVMAMTGTAGLTAVLLALRNGKTVALATKEIIVAYGDIVIKTARRFGAQILPIDSELAALHQCLNGKTPTALKQLILTASGGPFWHQGPPADADIKTVLRHPTWKMGKKITVDSATLMNKGFEVIETVRLFGVHPNQVKTVIHPQSIVHSLVEFQDGSIIAQLSRPDMCLPIQYCLTYPDRLPSLVKPLELDKASPLEFISPDQRRFPCLTLAYRALKSGPAATCVLNAANEIAVSAFLQGKIAFGFIPVIIKKTLNTHMKQKTPKTISLSGLRRIETWATGYARSLI